MKLSDFLKKNAKSEPKAKVTKLEKSQLEKVIGGGDDPANSELSTPAHSTTMSIISKIRA